MIVIKKKSPNPYSRWLNAKPGRVISVSFLLVITIGALLLTLPIASASGQSVGFLKALFTATSATCVTGLVVVGTNVDWTVFGKVVIIALIQIGGLGLVTITSFFYSFMRRKTSLRTLVVAQESTASFGFADVLKLVRKIMIITFTTEFIGGVILSWRFIPEHGFWSGLGMGFFQSVSAFCNAGFALTGSNQEDAYINLMGYNGDPIVLMTTGLLVVFGGLGFVVWSDLLGFRKAKKLNFHSKVVLVMTGSLLLIGALFFLGAEYFNTANTYSMGSLPEWQRPFAALFQSITPRTAGFNSIDQATMTDGSKFMSIILMFIGAAPGSTGGGIKVSTFAVILATIVSDIRGRNDIVLLKHRLPRETFTRAFAIFGMALALVMTATMLLTFIEHGQFRFIDLLFEATSAFGTVGISSANTQTLQALSWMVLIPVMYLGRIGPASFAISLAMKKNDKHELVHPEGKTLVG